MAPIGEPPRDAEDWSDEQWLEWLKATDNADDPAQDVDERRASAPRIIHSAGGQVLGQAMIGLANAIYGPKEDNVAIVVEAGEPDSDGPLTVHLDLEHPERSSVTIKAAPEKPEGAT